MNISKIENWSLGYVLLRLWVVKLWHDKIYYKKIIISNPENIPESGHFIFTPNHQNALMDALALISVSKTQLVFLARSDIFAKPFIAKLLIFIKILPIYRIRDGFDAVKKNDDVFVKTVDVVKNQNGLAILPEGNHDGHRRLRPFKKGFARIAFQTEEANNFNMDIKIIPIGLDYSSYDKYQSTLHINFGKPLSVSDYYDIYRENPVKGINKLTNELPDHIRPLMVNIESVEYYTLYDELREIYKNYMCKRLSLPNSEQPHKLKADQKLIRTLEKYEKDNKDEMTEFQKIVIRFKTNVNRLKLNYSIFENEVPSFISLLIKSLFLLIISPAFIYGLINNYLIYKIPLIIVKKIKDKQFHSSFKSVISLLLTTVLHTLQTVLFLIISKSWKLTGIYFISLPFSGMFAWWYHVQFKELGIQWRYFSYQRKDHSVFKETSKLYQNIINKTNGIVYQYL
jgi:1-acyl-sn-glycerol-3-phosphate acyltransferase